MDSGLGSQRWGDQAALGRGTCWDGSGSGLSGQVHLPVDPKGDPEPQLPPSASPDPCPHAGPPASLEDCLLTWAEQVRGWRGTEPSHLLLGASLRSAGAAALTTRPKSSRVLWGLEGWTEGVRASSLEMGGVCCPFTGMSSEMSRQCGLAQAFLLSPSWIPAPLTPT